MAETQKSQVIDGRTLRAKARREATKEVILRK